MLQCPPTRRGYPSDREGGATTRATIIGAHRHLRHLRHLRSHLGPRRRRLHAHLRAHLRARLDGHLHARPNARARARSSRQT